MLWVIVFQSSLIGTFQFHYRKSRKTLQWQFVVQLIGSSQMTSCENIYVIFHPLQFFAQCIFATFHALGTVIVWNAYINIKCFFAWFNPFGIQLRNLTNLTFPILFYAYQSILFAVLVPHNVISTRSWKTP